MELITLVIMFILFSTPDGDKLTWLPVPDMTTCEIMANSVVGMIDYKCVQPYGEDV